MLNCRPQFLEKSRWAFYEQQCSIFSSMSSAYEAHVRGGELSHLPLYLGDVHHIFLHSASVSGAKEASKSCAYFIVEINSFSRTHFPPRWRILFWVIHHRSNSFWWWITRTCYQMGLFWYSCIIWSIRLIYQPSELLLWLCTSCSYIISHRFCWSAVQYASLMFHSKD